MDEDKKRKAVNTAAAVLAYRNRSSQKLLDRLLEKEMEEDLAVYAVARLAELGVLNDREYAESLVRSCVSKGWGATRVKQKLKSQKLETELIDEIMSVFEPDTDKIDSFIMSKLKGEKPDRAAVKRVSDGLFRRGFSWSEISAAMSKYVEGLEFIDE